MRLGIDSFSYHLHFGKHWFKPGEEFDIKWFCNHCKYLNVDGIHLDPMHFNLADDIKWLYEFVNKNNFYIELGAMGISPEEITPALSAAREVGSKVLRIFTPGNCNEGREVSKKNAALAKETLKRSVEIAEKYNVILALENHGDLFFEDFLEVLSIDSPFLGVCFDSGNFATIGKNALDALNMLSDKIVCTHIKDIYPPESFPDAEPFGIEGYKFHFGEIGKGLLPLEDIVANIKKAKGENFNISLEIHTPFHKSLSEEELLDRENENVVKSIKYARERLDIK